MYVQDFDGLKEFGTLVHYDAAGVIILSSHTGLLASKLLARSDVSFRSSERRSLISGDKKGGWPRLDDRNLSDL
jgi:hypothetical protein